MSGRRVGKVVDVQLGMAGQKEQEGKGYGGGLARRGSEDL